MEVKHIKLTLTGDRERDQAAIAEALKENPNALKVANRAKLSHDLREVGWETERACSAMQAMQLIDGYNQEMGFVLSHLAQDHGVLQAALVAKELFTLLHSAACILNEAAFVLRASILDESVEPIIRQNRDNFTELYNDMKAREDLENEVSGHG